MQMVSELIDLLLSRWLTTMFRASIVLVPLTFLFWVIRPSFLEDFRISQPKDVRTRSIEELPRLILGLSVYIIPTGILYLTKHFFGYSRMYTDINQFGVAYFVFSIFLFMVISDTWFYWSHRLMHTNSYLKKVHAVHHRSYNVTPISSYSFHLVEALLNMTPYLFLLLVFPWHPLAIVLIGFFGLTYNGYLHLGYDVRDELRARIPGLNFFYSSTHHSRHHQNNSGNYGLYFTFWDKIMKTEFVRKSNSRH